MENYENQIDITVDDIRKSKSYQTKVRKYYLDRYGPQYSGLKERDNEKLVDDFFGHLSWAEGNTVMAAGMIKFTNSASEEELNNLSSLYNVYSNTIPKFYEEGGRGWLDGLWDHVGSAVIDPSTFLSFVTGGGSKVATTAATRATIKAALKRGIKEGKDIDVVRKNIRRGKITTPEGRMAAAPAIKKGAMRGALIDASIAGIQDKQVQTFQEDLGVIDDYQPLRGLVAITLGAVPGAIASGVAAGRTRLGQAVKDRETRKGNLTNKFSRPLNEKEKLKLTDKDGKRIRGQLTKEMKKFFEDVTAAGNETLIRVGKRWGFRPAGQRYAKPGSLQQKTQEIGKTTEDLAEEGSKYLETRLSKDVLDRVTLALQGFVDAVGEPWDSIKFPRITQQVYDWHKSGKIKREVFIDILDEFEIDMNLFADVIYATGSRAGSELGTISGWRRILDDVSGTQSRFGNALGIERTPFEEEIYRLEQLAKESGTPTNAFDLFFNNKTIAKLNQNRLLSLVGQTGTAVRNVMSVAGARVAPDLLVQGFNNTMNKLIGKKQVKFTDMFSTLYYLTDPRRNREGLVTTMELLKDSPKTAQRLLTEWSEAANPMINANDGWYSRTVHWLNGFNRGQEQYFRSAFFMSDIERQLNGKGINLSDVISEGKLLDAGVIDDKMIQRATNKALKATFADRPDTSTSIGKFANSAINVIRRSPLNIFMPFPRFVVSALNYTIDFSPVGLLRESPLLNYAGRAAAKVTGKKELGAIGGRAAARLKDGDFTGIGEGLLGTGTYLGAFSMVNSGMIGEQPFELKIGEQVDPDIIKGKTKLQSTEGLDEQARQQYVDTRALFPLPVFLTIAELTHQFYTGNKKTAEDNLRNILQVTLGSQARIGPLAAGLESSLAGMLNQDSDVQQETLVKIMAGVMPQYFVPYQMVNDVLMQTNMQDSFVRSTRGTGMAAGKSGNTYSPFTDAISTKLPNFIGDAVHRYLYDEEIKYNIDPTLPPGERVERYSPILKQLMGTTITEKHITRQVLEYWGINYKDYSPYSPDDRDLTRLAQINMQYYINTVLAPELLLEGTKFSKNVNDFYDARKRGDTDFTNAIIVADLKELLTEMKSSAMQEAKSDAPNLAAAAAGIIKNYTAKQAAAQRRVVEGFSPDVATAKAETKKEIYDTAGRDQFVDPFLQLKRSPTGGLMGVDRMGEVPEDTLSQEEIEQYERLFGNK